MKKESLLENLRTLDKECCYLEKAAAMLQWDQETCLPDLGVEDRAEQIALLGGIIHDRFTAKQTGNMLNELGVTSDNLRGDESLPDIDRDFLRVIYRKYNRAVKLPRDFVISTAKAEGHSHAAWVKAKNTNNFDAFLPHLIKMVESAKQKSLYWGYTKNPYDGLLDIYEPGMTSDKISDVFNPVKERLASLLKKITGQTSADVSFLQQDFNKESQVRFNLDLMKKLGFDFNRGRLDTSAHPFTTSLGTNDVRITTRYDSANLLSSIFSVIHECGHAFYEMAFPCEIKNSSLADGASMGIHESQSRFWENIIGRSRSFWEVFFPLIASYFPGQFKIAGKNINAEDFYRAVNEVKPSLIRVDADEVSYSLHIIMRFEIEKQLFNGQLDPVSLPLFWKTISKEILGVEPQNDSEGVLQDVHWSGGAFGYFPSYALGNLYGLHFWEKIKADINGVEEKIANSDFAPIRAWLKDNICVWGRRLEPSVLLKTVTGKNLSPDPFFNYIESKYSGLYGF